MSGPSYPDCDEADLRATLNAVAELDPLTMFHEPINLRAENVARIEAEARHLGVTLSTQVFATRDRWEDYALDSLRTVERLASEIEIADCLHLWPDKSLGSRAALKRQSDPERHLSRLQMWWSRVSEWPCG